MGVAGTKLQLSSRDAVKQVQADTGVTPPRPVSVKQSRVISHTVREGCVPVFKEWLDTAKPDEKQLVLDMLKAGNNKEKRIQRATEELLQPDVLPDVQDWLTRISDKEQQMLVNILEMLAKVHKQTSSDDSSRARSSSFPPNKQLQRPSSSKLQYSRHHHPSQLKPRPHSATPQDHRQQTPILWNHKLNRGPVNNVLHPGSVFNLPHKYRGQHFAIHPEWPTA